MQHLDGVIKALPLHHLPPGAALFLSEPINFLAVCVALVILLITIGKNIILFYNCYFLILQAIINSLLNYHFSPVFTFWKRDKRTTFLLLGPRESGKTALLFRVIDEVSDSFFRIAYGIL